MKTLCGTPQYLAPEVVEQARASKMSGYTEAVDIWALGVILYILLCGYPPFGSKDFDDIIEAKYDFNHSRWKSVSKVAKQLIGSLLLKDPKKRMKIADVCRHKWLAGVTVPPLPDHLPPLPEATSSQASRVGSPRRARIVPDPDSRAVRFEEQTREPTEALRNSAGSRKLRDRQPTGAAKRERREEDADEEEEDEYREDQAPRSEVKISHLKRLKLMDLKEKCRAEGLPDDGRKDELINRIMEHRSKK
jgi:serine/threonine protein kinase